MGGRLYQPGTQKESTHNLWGEDPKGRALPQNMTPHSLRESVNGKAKAKHKDENMHAGNGSAGNSPTAQRT